jgi:hypothetical protein
MALKMFAMNAPMEPLAGLAMDGAAGFSAGLVVPETDGVIVAPVNVIVGSSAIIAINRPAQPGWLSTTFGS